MLAEIRASGPTSRTFNAVNSMRMHGRWIQSSMAKAYEEFDDAGPMRPSAYYDRVVDVVEELFRFTLLMRARQLSCRSLQRSQEGVDEGDTRRAARHERDLNGPKSVFFFRNSEIDLKFVQRILLEELTGRVRRQAPAACTLDRCV